MFTLMNTHMSEAEVPVTHPIGDSISLGAALRARRKSLRLGQRDAAEIAGVSVHTLSDIETGKGNPTLETLLTLCELLGLELGLSERVPEALK